MPPTSPRLVTDVPTPGRPPHLTQAVTPHSWEPSLNLTRPPSSGFRKAKAKSQINIVKKVNVFKEHLW